jgi:decaprenylphospho-beta-D-ribofuranose 2-oxidase
MRRKNLLLSGWGRFPSARTDAFRPEKLSEVAACLRERDGPILARGAGRSYGDQALNSTGAVVLTERLDRFLSLETEGSAPTLTVEAGISLSAIQRLLIPRGFMLPVSPGTGFATVGGAIANDIHGKNHDADGSFGAHVASIDLLTASGDVRRLTPDETPREFWATVGGAGLTGIILAAALRLLKLSSNAVALREERMPDLAAFLNGLRAARAAARFSVGWIDALASGDSIGRGILETADLSADGVAVTTRKVKAIPFDLPTFCLSRPSVTLFNTAYYHRVPRAGRQSLRSIEAFLYPLDALAQWNRLYGKPGFSQFQAVLPDDAAETGLRALLNAVGQGGTASFLAVLKTLGAEGRGLLSFPRPGFTLALDLPRRAETGALLARLEAITLDHGGRMYLAKDSALSAAGFARMYPRLAEFQAIAAEMDPAGRFASDQSRRLSLRGA